MGLHVLTIAGTVLQAAQQRNQFRVKTVHAYFIGHSLSLLANGGFDLLFSLLNHFLYASRMDAAIQDQPAQSYTGHLTTHGIKAGENHRLRCVINHQIHPGGNFQSPDVAPSTANDTPFHVIARQGHHGYRSLRDLLGSTALDGQGDKFSGLTISFFFSLGFNLSDYPRHILTALFFDSFQEQLLGFFPAQGGYPL